MKIESFFEVIENLLNSTKKGKLNWGLSSNANQLLTEFNLSDLTLTKDINELDDYIKFTFYFCAGPDSNFTFNVVKDIDYGDSEEISINFQDEFGEIVDEHFPDRPDYIWEVTNTLFTNAHKQALDIGGTFDEIMDELNEKDEKIATKNNDIENTFDEDIPF